MGVLYPLLPFGLSSPTRNRGQSSYSGFPQNRSPLKGNPPFWGKPSALAHYCFRGRHLCGAAMLCRLQCARCAKRVAHCRRTTRLALGTHTVAACCGSAPNKCASCTGWGRAATCKRGRMFAHGASLAERRVVPSSKEKRRARGRAPELFYYKSAPSVASEAATPGAILYKSLGSRGIMPLAGVQGRRPCLVQRAEPLPAYAPK